MKNITDKKILVTGGNGFLGKHLVQILRENTKNCLIFTPNKSKLDLTDQKQTKKYFKKMRPDIVFHLAANVGGIGANQKNPGTFFYNNAMMGLNVYENCRKYQVEKLISVGTICSYPKFCPIPFKEEDIWNGYPEETNAPYGIAKKSLLVLADGYKQQFNLNSIVLFPANMYGPYDNFDDNSSHVIPALIKKMYAAKENDDDEVLLWGDGCPTREFLHVQDAAKAIFLSYFNYNSVEPLNIGTSQEISIFDLAYKIKRLINFEGDINWDITKPNGQPRRKVDTTKANKVLNWYPEVDFETGLLETIKYWESISE